MLQVPRKLVLTIEGLEKALVAKSGAADMAGVKMEKME